MLLFIYKYYFRVDVHGIENLPADGPGLIVSNHAPILPFDAAMILMACLVEPEKPRFVRTIINRAIASIPFGSVLILRGGQVIGCDENVQRVFENATPDPDHSGFGLRPDDGRSYTPRRRMTSAPATMQMTTTMHRPMTPMVGSAPGGTTMYRAGGDTRMALLSSSATQV